MAPGRQNNNGRFRGWLFSLAILALFLLPVLWSLYSRGSFPRIFFLPLLFGFFPGAFIGRGSKKKAQKEPPPEEMPENGTDFASRELHREQSASNALGDARYCPVCGGRVNGDFIFCPYCGGRLKK